MLNASVATGVKSERRMPAISNKDLDDDLLDFVVLTSAAETYLQNTDTIVVGNHNKIHLLETCGSIKNLIRLCGPPCHLILGLQDLETATAQRNRYLTRLAILKNNFPLHEVENIPINCSPDIFFETLMISVKNDVISHQSFMRKTKLNMISALKRNLQI
jgi:hypothetical protein